MARNPTTPTAALPFMASWTAVNMDLTSTTAATAPVDMGQHLCAGETWGWVPMMACDSATGTCTMNLCMTDKSSQYGNVVVWAQDVAFTAISRRMGLANSTGLYLMYPSGLYFAYDLRGVHTAGARTFFLSLAVLAVATQVVMIDHFAARIT